MRTRTENLDRDSLLMLYAAGELPAEQQQQVDQMLARDESLKAELAQLLDAQVLLNRGLTDLDKIDPLPVSATSAVRAVMRDLRQRQVDELAKPMKVAPRDRKRWLGLLYPAGIAAAVIGYGVYRWSKVQDDFSKPVPSQFAEDRIDERDSNFRIVASLFPDVDQRDSELDSVEQQINGLNDWNLPSQ